MGKPIPESLPEPIAQVIREGLIAYRASAQTNALRFEQLTGLNLRTDEQVKAYLAANGVKGIRRNYDKLADAQILDLVWRVATSKLRKKRKERTSKEAIIRRNVDICVKHHENPKLSDEALTRYFLKENGKRLTSQQIGNIRRQEPKWLKMLAEIEQNESN